MNYSTMAVEDLLDAFASSEPVPGGGSASALGAAVGVSLLIMVASLPKTRTGAPEEAADLSEAASRLRPLRDTLTSLIDQDSDAYEAVLTAYRLPKSSAAEIASRNTAVDTAMRGATEVPLETMRACQQALRGATVVAGNGYVNAATDTGVGVHLLLASLRGAGMNVDVNITSLKDAGYVARVKEERTELEAEGAADAATALARLPGARP